jgi:hypothetical protein
MNTRVLKTAALTCATGLLLGMSAITPASAATTTTAKWGSWTFDEQNTYEGDITFGDPSMPDAHWAPSVDEAPSNRATLAVVGTDTAGEYFGADTPIGAIAGANGPTGSFNFLKDTINGLAGTTVLGVRQDMNYIAINFATAVPADQLVIAASDIDSDHVSFLGKDVDGNFLTAEQLRGTAAATFSDLAFNFCSSASAPNSCTDTAVPAITTDSDGRIIATGQTSNTTGSSFWIRPSVPLKQLWIQVWNDDASNSSSIRLWAAQVTTTTTSDVTPSSSNLPQTGTGSALVPGLVASVLVTAGIGVLIIRSCRPEGNRRGQSRTL